MYIVGSPQVVPGLGHSGYDIRDAMLAARSNVSFGLRGLGSSDMLAGIDFKALLLTAGAAGLGAYLAMRFGGK